MESILQLQTNGEIKLNSPELISKIDELGRAMSAFQSTLKESKSTAPNARPGRAYSNADRARDDAQLRNINARRNVAETMYSPGVINYRQSNAEARKSAAEVQNMRQNLARDFFNRSKERYEAGDKKGAKDLENLAALTATGKSPSDNKNGAKGFWNSMAMIATAEYYSSGFKGIIHSNTSQNLVGLNNPMTSGYNIGSLTEQLANLQTQKNVGITQLALDTVGGIAGAIIGKSTGLGAYKGGAFGVAGTQAIASPFLDYYTGTQQVKNRRLNEIITNNMSLEALRATNVNAYGTAQKGLSGYNIVDNEVPFIIAISKATNLYNENSKAMSSLTKNVVNFAQASQMSLPDATRLGASAALMSKDRNFSFDNAKKIFNTYGISDYNGTMGSAIGFMQTGMDANKALLLAASIQGESPGFQTGVSNYYADPANRAVMNMVSNAFGGGASAFHNKNDLNHVRIIRDAQRRLNGINNMADQANPEAIAQERLLTLQYGLGGVSDIPIGDSANRALKNKRIGTTGLQSAVYKSFDRAQETGNGANLEKSMTKLFGASEQAAQSMGYLDKASLTLANTFNGISKTLSSHMNSGIMSGASESTQSKK